VLVALLAVPLGGTAAFAQESPRVGVDVMVSHISDGPGAIDPRARTLDAKLRKQFRYESLAVLESRRFDLKLDQVAAMQLPNGRKFRLRPLHVGDQGVLMAVSVEGTVETDLRVRNGHLVVIGAEQYRDGKLVISLEPHW
jgi:hypothetical protein